jgi:hypothetical protein
VNLDDEKFYLGMKLPETKICSKEEMTVKGTSLMTFDWQFSGG